MNEDASPDRKNGSKLCLDMLKTNINMNLKSLEVEPSAKYVCQPEDGCSVIAE